MTIRSRLRTHRTAELANPSLDPPSLPVLVVDAGGKELGKVTEDVDENRCLLVLRFREVRIGRIELRIFCVADGQIYA